MLVMVVQSAHIGDGWAASTSTRVTCTTAGHSQALAARREENLFLSAALHTVNQANLGTH